MRNIESGHPDFDQFDSGEQIVEGIRNILGPNVAFHHTVSRRDLGMTYGGLHENRGGAVAAMQKLVGDAKDSAKTDGRKVGLSQASALLASEWKNQAGIVELAEGEKYSPWGERYYTYTHGVDDGTHGSTNKG